MTLAHGQTPPLVLLVEQNEALRDRVLHDLDGGRFRSETAASKQEALDKAARLEPALVLVDSSLPGASKLLASLSRWHGGPGTIALVLDDKIDPDRVVSLLPADSVLSEPFSAADLNGLIGRWLAEKGELSAEPEPKGFLTDQVLAEVRAEVEGDALSAGAFVQAPAAAVETAPAIDTSQEGIGLGPYRLLERIGRGGMAEVWRARRIGLEGFSKTVAIKRILPELSRSAAFMAELVEEAKIAAQLSHGTITQIYDLGRVGREYYIAMELVEGPDLRQVLARAQSRGVELDVEFSLVVASRVARALEHVHTLCDFSGRCLNLVHRDVSPQNILIGVEGEVKVCDFGISQVAAERSPGQALRGKLHYMAPELLWRRQVDARADLFSLGAVLYEMLVGRRLFVDERNQLDSVAIRECRIDRPRQLKRSLPRRLEKLLMTLLAYEPGERYQTAAEVHAAIVSELAARTSVASAVIVRQAIKALYESP